MSTRRTFIRQTLGGSTALAANGLIPLLSAAGAASPQRVYEVGTVYLYYKWTPEAQIVRDLEAIAAIGINTINPYPSFLLSYGKPEPDFSKFDLILKTAQRVGLHVMATVFRTEMIPELATAKWPERFSPVESADDRQARLSLADQEAIDLIDYYSRATVQHFRDFPCVVAYNIWVEPHMTGFSLSGRGRDNPHFDRWFQEWGLKKYGSAAAWYTQWNDILLNQEYQRFDRPLFYWYASGHVLKHVNDLVKSIDPVRPTRTNTVGSTVLDQGIGIYSQDDWTLSRFVDQYGLSYYPDIPARSAEAKPELLAREKAFWDTPWTTSLELTSAHDAAGGKPFVIPEVQTAPQTGFTRYGAEPWTIYDYSRIHMLCWQMAAHDAKAMYFWKWRPFLVGWQAYGRGLVATDSSLTGRARAAGDAARAINSDPGLFLDSKPVIPEVAVVYDVIGDLKAVAQGRDWGSFTARNLVGIYRALWEDQVRINVLDGRELNASRLKPYKLVIFPFYLCLRKNVAEAIKAFVADGGTVLADARFGIIDTLDRGFPVNPGLGMAKLFGARRHDLVAGYSPFEVRTTGPVRLLKGIALPNQMVGRVFREDLQLEKGSEGTVAAVFEETRTPAVVVRRTGKGQSVLLGYSLGISLLEDHDLGTAGLLRGAWKSAGVKPPVRISTGQGVGPVEAVVHSRGREGERLVYVLNWGLQQAEVRAQLPWSGQARLRGKDIVSERDVPIERVEKGLAFTLTLPPKRAAAVHIQA